MASYERRAGAWRVKVHRKGVKVSATFPTKLQAQEWAARVESEAIAGHYGQPIRRTLSDAIFRFVEEVAPNRRGSRWEILRLSAFAEREKPLCARQLSSLSEADFAVWRDRRLTEVSASTVRREIALLGAVFSVAVREWKWASRNPLSGIRKPTPPPARRRGVTPEEADAIVSKLRQSGPASSQVASAFLLSLETGMRAGEIIGLTWDHVDLVKRVVTLPKTKNGDSRRVPLSSAAIHIILDRRRTEPKTTPVFTITGASLDVLFRRARKAIDLPSIATLRFHDARGEAITRLSRNLDVLELARVVGHRDLQSLMLYYNKSAEELAKKLY